MNARIKNLMAKSTALLEEFTACGNELEASYGALSEAEKDSNYGNTLYDKIGALNAVTLSCDEIVDTLETALD